ncbi:MAG: radical SAM protein [Chloroflexi bacterium]|nr:radical SAM protein [Chloroflexota bacterium]
MSKNENWVEVDEQGRLVLPPKVAEHYGIQPGAQMRLKESSKNLHLQRPITHLAKVYVEPTSRCNLTCQTCIRNAWEEPQGDMSAETWNRVFESLKVLPSRPDVFFGGFGEPLLLPNIAGMVAQVKAVAGKVELITNGMLLTEQRSRELIEAGLDTLWVSLDGATPEHYADVRLGAALPQVVENIRRIAIMRHETSRRPEIGISFVAMRKNIADLPALIRMGPKLGISRYMVTNVFPYTKEMCEEMLCSRAVDGEDSPPSPWAPRIDLPRIDLNEASQDAILQTLRNRHNVRWNGVTLGQDRGRCLFIEKGAITVCWDGAVSPCLALMHSYPTYLNGQDRTVRRYVLGNLAGRDLNSIWAAPDYVAFRKRVQEFDFAPCTRCGGCQMAEKNEEDCFGNMFPTCGGCLWAQGVIQCP